MFYDIKFGRKKETKEEVTEAGSDHNGSYGNGLIHANGRRKNAADLAVYEQFEQQVCFP